MNSYEHSTVYFGYGSNLWKQQMKLRCPTSTYQGIAQLKGYCWIINERGYANVVKHTQTVQSDSQCTYASEVWGLVFTLQPADEARLDVNEGVPYAYQKQMLKCEFWPAREGKPPQTDEKPEHVEMLVYVDGERTTPSRPKTEYVYRMNMGIKDAVKEGMPKEYVEHALRPFIPELEDEGVAEVARKQALDFEDET
ncbi:hypothetical protein BAUCODRAFT_229127 [Baudoinia panamericana UAMH 10762]|uniref:gamma-glutamylcyclotransferase n=1 Tax=Baudoinia panamericana (strain UAMH 10762) TaxID=717646 RepID=M2LGE7_BAUPA|nr:uncharacterized protein BAUCODRAFT_229127 [Baudoinia panamericana UAMH 10762]EMC93137.1 hypothetical protein BAUCODRAFT_229127 [Baudoinia panamericana UAMH 10762]